MGCLWQLQNKGKYDDNDDDVRWHDQTWLYPHAIRLKIGFVYVASLVVHKLRHDECLSRLQRQWTDFSIVC